MELYSGLSTEQKCDMFLAAINRPYADPRKVDLKINYDGILCHMHHECYRENQVSYFPIVNVNRKMYKILNLVMYNFVHY